MYYIKYYRNTINHLLLESFNNRLGIAKSINDDLKNTDEISIIEMGTYGFGEIREICSWVKPHISVITGIAPVHLERMKS